MRRDLMDKKDGGAPPKRPRGRPVTNTMPEPIPDTPENIARALLTTPPKSEKDWDYLKDREIEVVGARLRREKKKDKEA